MSRMFSFLNIRTQRKGVAVSNPVNIDRELTDDQFRLIGVELRANTYQYGQQELAMFSTNLILPRIRSIPGGGGMWSDGYMPNVTIHTTVGDYTLTPMDYANW